MIMDERRYVLVDGVDSVSQQEEDDDPGDEQHDRYGQEEQGKQQRLYKVDAAEDEQGEDSLAFSGDITTLEIG